MNIEEIFKKFDSDLHDEGFDYITSVNKKMNGVQAGLIGEHDVYKVLRKYTDNIQKDVVMWDRRKNFTTEVDFVCNINGILVLVEAKEWYGTILKGKDSSEVKVSFVNFDGKKITNPRTSPRFQLATFTKDLKSYFKARGLTNIHMKKLIVFTRRELTIEDEDFYDKTKMCYLDELDERIKEVIDADHSMCYYNLDFQLPSWDYFYNDKHDLWSKKVLLNKEIQTNEDVIDVSLIDSMYFDDYTSDHVYVKLKNGSIIERYIDRKQFVTNSKPKFVTRSVQYIKLDNKLHEI